MGKHIWVLLVFCAGVSVGGSAQVLDEENFDKIEEVTYAELAEMAKKEGGGRQYAKAIKWINEYIALYKSNEAHITKRDQTEIKAYSSFYSMALSSEELAFFKDSKVGSESGLVSALATAISSRADFDKLTGLGYVGFGNTCEVIRGMREVTLNPNASIFINNKNKINGHMRRYAVPSSAILNTFKWGGTKKLVYPPEIFAMSDFILTVPKEVQKDVIGAPVTEYSLKPAYVDAMKGLLAPDVAEVNAQAVQDGLLAFLKANEAKKPKVVGVFCDSTSSRTPTSREGGNQKLSRDRALSCLTASKRALQTIDKKYWMTSELNFDDGSFTEKSVDEFKQELASSMTSLNGDYSNWKVRIGMNGVGEHKDGTSGPQFYKCFWTGYSNPTTCSAQIGIPAEATSVWKADCQCETAPGSGFFTKLPSKAIQDQWMTGDRSLYLGHQATRAFFIVALETSTTVPGAVSTQTVKEDVELPCVTYAYYYPTGDAPNFKPRIPRSSSSGGKKAYRPEKRKGMHAIPCPDFN